MPLKLVIAMFIAIGVAQATEPVVPVRGEGTTAFLCRATYIPQARQCVAGCEKSFAAEGLEDERFGCIQDCTLMRLQAMRDCRQGERPLAGDVAAR